MFGMFLLRVRVDKNVVQVGDSCLVQVCSDDVVDQCLTYCLCDEFVQCVDCSSVEGDFILHVFLESTSVHDHQGVVVPVSQY